MKKNWLSLLLAALCLLAGCGSGASGRTDPVPPNEYDESAFAVENGFLTYQGGGPSIVGVDVSSYQQDVDWQRVAAAGVEFAIIRVGYRGCTEGGLYEDSHFRQNIEGALAAGLDVGVYLFSQAVTPEEAEEEAAFLLERIEGYHITYPVVFDWERQSMEGSRTVSTSGAVQTDCAVAFCEAVERAGYLPMVYFSPSKGYGELELERLMGWPFWLAHYTEDWAPTGFRYHYAMWQYSCEGAVDGIGGAVDLNLCLTDFQHKYE